MPLPNTPFLDALRADGPDPRLADALQLYGRFVGSWDAAIVDHGADGHMLHSTAEWHFGWVLQGLAIQDVWIAPTRGTPQASLPSGYLYRYGSTLRLYEPARQQWRITWADPSLGLYVTQIGRAQGDDIVQEGRAADGVPMRWSFREIRPDSFRWLGEVSDDDGASWRLRLEMRARRR
ncbi:hypothetical protein [Rhodanobacter aciditrophus]|uniref:hypothetical protein n=1 Tax=Rhodanobacter aciditrophus TaxID=1623218 RepID=UPI003CF7F0FF